MGMYDRDYYRNQYSNENELSDKEYYRQYSDRRKSINNNFNSVPKETFVKSTKKKIGWKWVFLSLLISGILWVFTGALDLPLRFLFVSIPISTITTTATKTYYKH
ncbi:hypothetical protein IW492_17435 [Enterococcus sp. BWB1-3]|uniref:hypothetical protein n=1 Tax=Enterococcus sp. BWB1-3 TaxID=2787713 RepID=UPI0019216C82|nr:hypothetical protein [Enterococcus sp. BWB1-3]MBL1231010.1 hypothetical protein [Enterococcus sp. BWB1-3]